jgi:hypothetical protein
MSRLATPSDQLFFDNAFWAAQPAVVRTLRTDDDYEHRKLVASVLADFGFL